MQKEKYSDEEIVRSWRFWHWQYVRRNDEYIKAFREYERDKGEAKARKRSEFQERFGCFPIDPQRGPSADEIVTQAFGDGIDKRKAVYAGQIPYPIYSHVTDFGDGTEAFTYKVELQRDLDLILAEVAFWYRQKKREKVFGNEDFIRETNQELAHLIRIYLKREAFMSEDRARAAGLWLWQYVRSEEGPQRGIKRRAVRALYKKINLGKQKKLGRHRKYMSLDKEGQDDPESAYKRMIRNLDNASLCITSMKILPINP